MAETTNTTTSAATSTTSATGIDAIEVLKTRKDIFQLLFEAVESSNGRHSIETLCADLMATRARLWIRKNSAIVTEIAEYPTGARWLGVRIGTGHIKTLQAMVKELEKYASEKELAGVESAGRKGWTRIGKPMGYETTHYFMEKAI